MRDILLDPGGELWGGCGVQGDHLFEAALSGGKVGAEEDAAHGFSHSGALVKARDVGLSVLLEVELAPVARGGRGKPQHGPP